MLKKNLPRSLFVLILSIALMNFAKSDTILIVSDNSGRSVNYDLAALEALDSTTLTTHTPWTDGEQRFTGVRASVLLAAARASGTTVRALTLNDYETSMSVRDLTDYHAIIAYKRNGEYITIRDKGPLWIIFPLDYFTGLDSLKAEQKMAWHLHQLIVE